MSLLFRNWLDEGYYIENSWGDLERTDDPKEIRRASLNGNLYHHDGYSLSKEDSIFEDLNKTWDNEEE